jgi:hypothetical protein
MRKSARERKIVLERLAAAAPADSTEGFFIRRRLSAMLRRSLLACLTCLVACLGFASADPITFGVTDTGKFGSMDLGTGNFTPIADAYASGYAGLGNLADGTLVSIDFADNIFVWIDPKTGAATPIGPTGMFVTVYCSMLTGEQYAIDDQNQLFQIDPTTGAARLVGPTGIPGINVNGFANAFAGNSTSLYYIYEQLGDDTNTPVPSTLYKLDVATGAATAIGPTGTSNLVGAGFANGVLYAYGYDGIIYTIDVTTGTATAGPTYSSDFAIFGSNVGAAVQ